MTNTTLTRYQIAALKNLDKVIRPHRKKLAKLDAKMMELQSEYDEIMKQIEQMEAIANQHTGGKDYRDFIPGYYGTVEVVEEEDNSIPVATEDLGETSSFTVENRFLGDADPFMSESEINE